MKKRFSETQIIRILREGERAESIRQVCRQHAITEQTFYRWRKKYGEMSVAEVKRLRELERENTRLKRLLAEKELALDALRDWLGKK